MYALIIIKKYKKQFKNEKKIKITTAIINIKSISYLIRFTEINLTRVAVTNLG